MDYSQFLLMKEELSLLLVIAILFIYDLIVCPDKKSGRGIYNSILPVALLAIHTVINIIPSNETVSAFGGMYVATPMMSIMKSILSTGTLVTFLLAHEWLKKEENLVKQGEFYLLTLFTLLGMFFMMSSGHFLMFFIGLETASVPLAALIAFKKKNNQSAEAAAKFILIALFSSALLTYGLSFLYGVTGTLYFDDIAAKLTTGSLVVILALAFFISGLGFKVSLVPFHLWTADTYEGAPTVVTAYLSVISKGAAAFALFVILIKVFAPLVDHWNEVFFWIIIVSITIANLFAVRQNNIKRFMAFSAISQAGYLVLAIMGGTGEGMTAMVYYLLIYMVANFGVFAVIIITEQRSNKVNISDYNGFYATNPKLSFLMTLCLFSLGGIPPFAGFFSKFFIFMAAFNAGFHLLVFIALVNTIISLYYYLLIVKAMYINKNDQPIGTFESDTYTKVALAICIIGVAGLGLAGGVYEYINQFAYGITDLFATL